MAKRKGPESGEPKVEQPEKKSKFVYSQIEMGGEHIPSKEEVQDKFKEIIGGEFKEIRIHEDEQGLYLWEVETPGEKPGEINLYEYRRGVGGPESKGKVNSIAVVYFDADGMPSGGKTVADCVEGVWTMK